MHRRRTGYRRRYRAHRIAQEPDRLVPVSSDEPSQSLPPLAHRPPRRGGIIYVARSSIRELEVGHRQPPPRGLAVPVLSREASVLFEATEQIASGAVYISAGTRRLPKLQIGR